MDALTIADLQDSGAFVGKETEQATIKWAGKEMAVYVAKLSFGVVNRLWAIEDTAERNSQMIIRGIRADVKGKPLLTKAQADDLAPGLAAEFLRVIGEVNAMDAGEDEEDSPES